MRLVDLAPIFDDPLDYNLDRLGHRDLLSRNHRQDGIRYRIHEFDHISVDDKLAVVEPCQFNHIPTGFKQHSSVIDIGLNIIIY